MGKNRAFSLYDIEEFLKEAGAQRINEGAVESLEEELDATVKELINEAQVYANYAGRKRLIKRSDVRLANEIGRSGTRSRIVSRARARARRNKVIVNGVSFTRVRAPSR